MRPDAAQPTTRFSNRVADYVKARPAYPRGVLDALVRSVGFARDWVVADVGAGTGISTRLLLEHGNRVVAIEPNDAMRAAADAQFASDPNYRSLPGTAEATTLDGTSVDLVLAAQAFHWFDRAGFRRECDRILRPGGCLALVWNDRQTAGTPFLDRYEQLLHEFGTDYKAVNHRNIGADDIASFFAPATMQLFELENAQHFDLDGLRSRLLSSSYAPAAEDPRSVPMLAALRELFDQTSTDGVVEMRYTTQLYVGRLKGGSP